MAFLAKVLAEVTGHFVQDKTGLKGVYDFTLDWAANSPASILTAVPEQLGLELNAQTHPVEMLVIDHAEKVIGDPARVNDFETGAHRI